jgi:biopolymer transport protein TolQ
MIVGNSLWQLIVQTDAISKAVLLSLLFMSIIMWTVFLCKAFLFYCKKRDLKTVLNQMRYARTVNEIIVIAQNKNNALPSYFLTHCVEHIKTVAKNTSKTADLGTIQTVDQIRGLIDQEIDTLMVWEEQYTPLISTCAVISPLLGLLGTVWGLIHAFMNISQTQMADIATVAPGIAEALITTLAGLIVAIPAVVMVNYLTAQVTTIEQQLIRCADYVIRIVQWSTLHKKEDICVDLAVDEQKEAQR